MLNRLGSQQWTKTKARVRKAMQDMAAEGCLPSSMPPQRHTAQGTAFSKDNEFPAGVPQKDAFTTTTAKPTIRHPAIRLQ